MRISFSSLQVAMHKALFLTMPLWLVLLLSHKEQ
jgi:hypothetical protein